MDTLTIEKAKEIWSYMSAGNSSEKSDAIVICCSYDLRVCDHACKLFDTGYSDTLVISGKSGNWTQNLWNQPEAHVFFERAIANGISKEQILMDFTRFYFKQKIQKHIDGTLLYATQEDILNHLNTNIKAKMTHVETQ